MRKVVLISCASKKLGYEALAKDLYISSLFKKSLAYAETMNPDVIYILSAEHGLLKLDDKILPYNEILKYEADKRKWAIKVSKQLERLENIKNTNFIFLAGKNYRKYLIPKMNHYEIPMEGLPIGKQLQFLKAKLT